MSLPIHFAPLQGYTDDVYRRIHHDLFGGITTYYTPFVRMEGGGVRSKDMRDIRPEFNEGVPVVPQIIVKSMKEFEYLTNVVEEKGYQEIDINMGCPFPMQAKHGRGSGLLAHTDIIQEISQAIQEKKHLHFSVKMRLGWEDANECMTLLPLLNSLPLSHITMHPRLGKQQYKGEVDLEAFQRFYAECEKPLIYNGDLLTLEDIDTISNRFPRLGGLMIGRGLLANPALAIEYQQGAPLSPKEKIEKIRLLHADVFSQYGNLLEGGDLQLLTKMRTFWEYLLPDGDRKAKKVIHKTSKLSNYQAAVSNLLK